MIRTELEIIRINEDVITTSGLSVICVFHINKNGDQIDEVYSSDVIAQDTAKAAIITSFCGNIDQEFLENNTEPNTYYHLNSDGSIGSVCNNISEHPDFYDINRN